MQFQDWIKKRDKNKEHWFHSKKHNCFTKFIYFVIKKFSKNINENEFISTHCFKVIYHTIPKNTYPIQDIMKIVKICSVMLILSIYLQVFTLSFIMLFCIIYFNYYYRYYKEKNDIILNNNFKEKKDWLVLELSNDNVIHLLSSYILNKKIDDFECFEMKNILQQDFTITKEYKDLQISLYQYLDFDNKIFNNIISLIKYPILKASATMYFSKKFINCFFDILRDTNILIFELIINKLCKLIFKYKLFNELNPCVTLLVSNHLYAEKMNLFKLHPEYYNINNKLNINNVAELTTQDLFLINKNLELLSL